MKTRICCWLIAIGLCFGVTGCKAQEPETVGITGIVYNYTQDDFAWVKVNGKTVGSVLEGVTSGRVGGGSGMCCFRLPVGATQAEVYFEPAKGEGYTVTAAIEKWWPDLAHYGVVHVLPGRKVVMQVTPSWPAPRKDLLEARQQELGQEKKVLFQAWSAGPIERVDGKQ